MVSISKLWGLKKLNSGADLQNHLDQNQIEEGITVLRPLAVLFAKG
jgi:hypothetical protein